MSEFENDGQEPMLLPLDGRDGARKRPGRPAGALNKKTQALGKYLTGLGYRDPALVLAETYSRPVEELADVLECDMLDAYKLQQAAAAELMPYLHGKKPIEVNVTDERLPVLVLDLGTNQLDQARAGIAGGGALGVMSIGAPAETEDVEYQEVSGSDDDASHGKASHE